MTREEALRRLQETSNFTLVDGRVRITDRRTLAALAEARGAEPEPVSGRFAAGPRQAPSVSQAVA